MDLPCASLAERSSSPMVLRLDHPFGHGACTTLREFGK
jgi:hypothetical protein